MNENEYFAKLAEELEQYKMDDTECARMEIWVHRKYKELGFDLKRAEEFNEKCLSLVIKPNFNELESLYTKTSKKGWYNLLNSLDIIELLNSNDKFTPKQKSLLQLYFYLNIIEGTITEYVEVIALLLVKNGHDIYDPRRMQFAKCLEDIQNIDLYIKEQFLEAHGFEFITSTVDRSLRNCIAHQDFIIYNDGEIKNLKTQQTINIEKKLDELQITCMIVSVTIMRIYDVLVPELTEIAAGK